MAQIVGSYGVATFTSPSNGDTLDATVVKGNDNNLRSAYVSHDADGGLHLQSSSLATRASAGTLGRKWLTTDASSYRLFFDDGSAWYELSYLSTAGGTITGNLTVTGTITGAVTGNAATATALQTSRNINGTSFNGTADITVTAAAGTLTGATLASGVTASSLTSVGTLTSLAVSGAATVGTTLGVTGVTTIAAGTAALPALTTTGDTNTGFLFPAADTIALSTGGSERARIDASGNLGLGVTPSAWTAAARAVQFGSVGAMYQDGSGGVELAQNAYESAVNTYRYLISFNASRYEQQSGQHKWFNAPSGTAGNAISFTQAMTLDASGNLGIGNTVPGTDGGVIPRLAVANPLNSDKFVGIGYNDAGDYGFIHSIHRSVTWKNLALQAFGGSVGVGTTSPGVALDVQSPITTQIRALMTGVNGAETRMLGDTLAGAVGTYSNHEFAIKTNATTVAVFSTSGNLGLGVTPSAWAPSTRALDFAFPLVGMDTDGAGVFGFNCYNSTGSTWNYKASDEACLFTATNAGKFTWRTAPSGTAGNVISFTQAMTLDASGQLGIGTTSPAYKLDVSGSIASNGVELMTSDGTSNYIKTGTALYFQTGSTTKATLDSSGNLAAIGYMRVGAASAGAASTTTIGSTTATTVGATGTASALPALPLGYIIAHVGTTQVKIPYYTA